MHSFTLTAVGNLARNPEAVAKGDVTYTRFCLVGNDYAGKDEKGSSREVVTTLWFVAFGPLGETLVHHARKGDQLFIEAQVRANNWTDKQGEKQYDHDFVVQGFRFGAPGKAKRDELSNKSEPVPRADGELKSSADPRTGLDTKVGTDDAGPAANGNGKVNASGNGEKPSAQRTGRRANAPPS